MCKWFLSIFSPPNERLRTNRKKFDDRNKSVDVEKYSRSKGRSTKRGNRDSELKKLEGKRNEGKESSTLERYKAADDFK